MIQFVAIKETTRVEQKSLWAFLRNLSYQAPNSQTNYLVNFVSDEPDRFESFVKPREHKEKYFSVIPWKPSIS